MAARRAKSSPNCKKILGGYPPPWQARAMGNRLALPPRLGMSGP